MSEPETQPKRIRQVADRGLVVLAGGSCLPLLGLLWFAVLRKGYTPGAGWLAPAAIGAALSGCVAFLALRRRLYVRVPPERLLVLALALGGPLLLVELVANLTNPRGYLYFAESQRYFAWQRYAGIPQSHAHPPSEELSFSWGTIRTNRQGWRAPEVEARPAPRTLRVVALGDSVMFGWGVPAAETFGEQLEAWLRERLGQGPLAGFDEVEVLNGGNGSYDSLDELLTLKAHGLDLAPHLVILLVIGNDFGRPAYRDQVELLARDALDPALIPTLSATAIERPPRIGPASQPWRGLYSGISYALNRSFLVISTANAIRLAGARAARSARASAPPAGKTDAATKAARPAKTKRAAGPAPQLLARYPFLREHAACLREVARVCRARSVPLLMLSFLPNGRELSAHLRADLAPLTPLIELTYPEGKDQKDFSNSVTDDHWNLAGSAWFAGQAGPHALERLR